MKYDFYEDPGHGWLKVPLAQLEELGIADQISRWSYRRGTHAYLEEDCDAPLFCKAMQEKGQTVEFVVHVARIKQSRIRNYQPYFFPYLRSN